MARRGITLAPPQGRAPLARGPLGPSSPDLTIFASLSDDGFGDTPADTVYRAKIASVLITDLPQLADQFSHKILILVGDSGIPDALLKAHFTVLSLPIPERIVYVAGSGELVNAAIVDAWKIIAEGPDAATPHIVSAWRAQRPKGATATTFTRD